MAAPSGRARGVCSDCPLAAATKLQCCSAFTISAGKADGQALPQSPTLAIEVRLQLAAKDNLALFGVFNFGGKASGLTCLDPAVAFGVQGAL